jgi:hypothetical protein
MDVPGKKCGRIFSSVAHTRAANEFVICFLSVPDDKRRRLKEVSCQVMRCLLARGFAVQQQLIAMRPDRHAADTGRKYSSNRYQKASRVHRAS